MNKFRSSVFLLTAAVLPCVLSAYEIGTDLQTSSFWTSDPVLYVSKHRSDGFQFTSDQREGADSRQDGAVTCFGVPVFETKVEFGEKGGVSRVELVLFSTGGTETLREHTSGHHKFRTRERVEKTLTRDEFDGILKTVRGKLTPANGKIPPEADGRMRNQNATQRSQTWPKTDIPTQSTLTWNYQQDGKDVATFQPGFIRLAVNGPLRLSAEKNQPKGKLSATGAKKIVDNILRDPRGDVFLDNIPMVDQGQKGYCSVATAERVLRYYGIEIDEHELAQAAGTSAERGTSTKAMKDSVAAVGRKYKLATMVVSGDFDKSNAARIDGIVNEVRVYNKAAKKLKKRPIEDATYIHRSGNMITYDVSAVDAAMDPEVLMEMKCNGGQKAKYKKFLSDVHQQIDKGVPLFWGVKLGVYPEPGLPQIGGYHMRLIIGYNDKKEEILYSDSWGAGHELKRIPSPWAWTITNCLMYMKPLTK